ncbi:MAG: hypothetical protein LBI19_07565 [Oscillospiraceae bacterium]|jgi:hypothetical protein|nr:hypothetical protein [Oscillospiraceae bacterium]
MDNLLKAINERRSRRKYLPAVLKQSDVDMLKSFISEFNAEGMAFDLGIAKLHFELGVGGGKWAFGNGAGFMRDSS